MFLKLAIIYAADGTKLSKNSVLGTRHYVAGVEYLGAGSSAAIDLIHTTERIARNASGNYHHEYFLKDHLGNTRVVFNGAGSVLQQTDYAIWYGDKPCGKLPKNGLYL